MKRRAFLGTVSALSLSFLLVPGFRSTKLSYETLKIRMQEVKFVSPSAWFAWIEKTGWTSAELREAANERRAAKGRCLIGSCVLCGFHHDTLELANICAAAEKEQERAA